MLWCNFEPRARFIDHEAEVDEDVSDDDEAELDNDYDRFVHARAKKKYR